jgi:hypothetical protein
MMAVRIYEVVAILYLTHAGMLCGNRSSKDIQVLFKETISRMQNNKYSSTHSLTSAVGIQSKAPPALAPPIL